MDVIMPQLGETVKEGTLTVWHKSAGDKVESGELLFEIGTDKVEMEIPAPASGTLSEVLVDEGATVAVGTRLAVIDDGSGAAAAPAEKAEAPKAEAPKPAANEAAGSASTATARGPNNARGARNGGQKLSPAVRKLVADNDLDPSLIPGTGKDGRITRGDVLQYLKSGPAERELAAEKPSAPRPSVPATVPKGGEGERMVIPFDYRRRAIAEHMVRSKATSAHVLQVVEANFSKVDAARKALGAEWKAKEGFSLTYLPFIAKAVCEAIRDYPRINAHIEDDSLVVFDSVHLAIAIDLDFEGLIAPVIRNADRRSVPELARAIADIAERARRGELTGDDMAGATYTITNNGSFGTVLTAPIINQPQVAILSTDGIARKPVAIEVDGEETLAIRPMGMLAQSFDHRGIDGAYSGAYLKRLKEVIETRDWRAAF